MWYQHELRCFQFLPEICLQVREERRPQKGRYKISEDSHYFIGDEIILRDRLEYDPSRVFGGSDEEEDEDY